MRLLVTLRLFNKKIEHKKLEVMYNNTNKKFKGIFLRQILSDYKPDIIIAGTEEYNKIELDCCANLKLICRAGIGYDNINLEECKKRGIIVTNTPTAPTNSVAEFTICQMINLLRKIPTVNKTWNRYIGKELTNCIIGIIGVGRIGGKVAQKLNSLTPKKIYINDIDKQKEKILNISYECIPKDLKCLLKKCDIITIHIPLKDTSINNTNFITKKELNMMKKDVKLINTSRGKIINENDLYNWLKKNNNVSLAQDVFANEPYNGILIKCENAYLTPHIGSCTEDSRRKMEEGSIREVINYIENKSFKNRIV